MKRDEIDITELLFSVTPHGQEGNDITEPQAQIHCNACGKVVHPTMHTYANGMHFCNIDCYQKGRKMNEPKNTVHCAYCGREIHVHFWRNGKAFCADTNARCLEKFEEGQTPPPLKERKPPKGW